MDHSIGIRVIDGKIDFSKDLTNEKIYIKACEHINLFINDVHCKNYEEYEVSWIDDITYTIDNQEGKRTLELLVTDDKMEASLRVKYIPTVEYKLKDFLQFTTRLSLEAEIENKFEPDYYTVLELKSFLSEKNIKYGIQEDMLEKLISGGDNGEIIVAKGEKPISDVPSEVKLLFTPTSMYFPQEESDEKIDYKNLFRISNVKKGDKIAEIIPEKIGKDGINIYGQVVKKPYVRLTPIVAKDGCVIEDNKIISTIDGKAHISGRTVSVNPVFCVETVNMETCNINFFGDIEVYDSVDDNMDVNAGGSLDVSKNVNTSNVITGGDITILGNAINSKILSGQIDIRKKEYADILSSYRNILMNIIEVVKEESKKTKNFTTKGFIKELTDEKYKDFQKIALRIVSFNIKNEIRGSHLSEYLKEKVLGYNILKMQSLNDLIMLSNILENEIEYYDRNSIVPLDIRLSYCQDCEIKSTGNIYITGKGEYTSVLTAMKDINFTRSDSVARGGIITSGNNITAGIVGSRAEIGTVLKVPKTGRISITHAYQNTTLFFDNYKYTLDREYINMQAFYNMSTRLIEIKDQAF